jgi:hypothetical protein
MDLFYSKIYHVYEMDMLAWNFCRIGVRITCCHGRRRDSLDIRKGVAYHSWRYGGLGMDLRYQNESDEPPYVKCNEYHGRRS